MQFRIWNNGGMASGLEKIHHYCSIGTFVLTAVLVAITVVPVFLSADPPKGRVVGWIMPSILAVALVVAGVLHFKARRQETDGLRSDYEGMMVLAANYKATIKTLQDQLAERDKTVAGLEKQIAKLKKSGASADFK
jgi:hypothetical protein